MANNQTTDQQTVARDIAAQDGVGPDVSSGIGPSRLPSTDPDTDLGHFSMMQRSCTTEQPRT